MGKIVLLDELSINKIAAGEVIERPASVIKEMVENSIDAGATNIVVEIKNGGISYIRVSDNGKGIAEDDLEMAFERHATSKIRNANDLLDVKSMGFRGEALASISAISNVELISKPEEQENGYRIVVEGGYVLEKQTAGCPNGTSITVRDLFYNTPVRYKFLKKDYTESGYVEDVITRIAQSYPEIAIKLINSGKTVIQTNGNGDLKTVIYSIYGKDIAEKIIDVNYEYEDVVITGIIGRPEIARSNRSQQLFFVNKRYVKDKILQSATEQAFKGMIPLGKFPFLSLNIDMNPNKVDVNVHPAKLEVRFEEEDKMFKAVYHAIKDTLLKGNSENIAIYNQQIQVPQTEKTEFKYTEFLQNDIQEDIQSKEEKTKNHLLSKLPTFNKSKEKKENDILNFGTEDLYKNSKQDEEESSSRNIVEEILKARMNNELKEQINTEENNEQLNKEEKIEQGENKEQENNEQRNVETINIEEQIYSVQEQEETQELKEKESKYNFDEMYMKTFGKRPLSNVETISVFESVPEFKKPVYKIIGIVFNTYIIIEMGEEMYVIDQHAAHERILYEKVKKNYYADNQSGTQMMLLPDIITLTHKEMEIVKENMPIFERAGFILEEFGENTIKLSGVPDICIDLETKEMFMEALDEINSLGRTAKQEIEERFIATVACKAAVKANMALNELEIKELMDTLLVLPNPFTCPHGRPTAIKMTKYEIEKKFARK